MNTHRILACLAVVGLAALLAPAASATLARRTIMQQATGICGANNPANDQYLRWLPTGLRNAGTANVSVVCSLWGDDGSSQPAFAAFVYFHNHKATGGNVYCTLTMGMPEYSQVSITRTVYVPAGATATVFWDADDYGTNTDKQWVNLQCALPPGYSLREVNMMYDEDIGT